MLRGAEELRVKESDRIQVMADGLATLGVEHEVYEDGIRIVGGPYGGGQVESHGDHRIAMSFAMAALRASAPITIHHCANVATSFPASPSWPGPPAWPWRCRHPGRTDDPRNHH